MNIAEKCRSPPVIVLSSRQMTDIETTFRDQIWPAAQIRSSPMVKLILDEQSELDELRWPNFTAKRAQRTTVQQFTGLHGSVGWTIEKSELPTQHRRKIEQLLFRWGIQSEDNARARLNHQQLEQIEDEFWANPSSVTAEYMYDANVQFFAQSSQPRRHPNIEKAHLFNMLSIHDVMNRFEDYEQMDKADGISSGFTYIGGRNSVAGVHREHYNLASYLTQHFGYKAFYAIYPPQNAEFATAMGKLPPSAKRFNGEPNSEHCDFWLGEHKCLLPSLQWLVDNGFIVYRALLGPGESVFTMPGCIWHFVLNLTEVCSSARNIALPEWLPMAYQFDKRTGCECRLEPGQPVFKLDVQGYGAQIERDGHYALVYMAKRNETKRQAERRRRERIAAEKGKNIPQQRPRDVELMSLDKAESDMQDVLGRERAFNENRKRRRQNGH